MLRNREGFSMPDSLGSASSRGASPQHNSRALAGASRGRWRAPSALLRNLPSESRCDSSAHLARGICRPEEEAEATADERLL